MSLALAYICKVKTKHVAIFFSSFVSVDSFAGGTNRHFYSFNGLICSHSIVVHSGMLFSLQTDSLQ
jgi:hypothetical protein